MANEVTTTQAQPEIVKFRSELEGRAGELKMVLPEHITPEKFQRTIVTTVMSDPELLRADRRSLLLACMKAAQDGLLPDKREAAIVVFKENKKIDGQWQSKLIAQYLPMVYGLRKKILQSGEVKALEVGVVYKAEVEAGKFLYEVGIEPPLRHRPMLELTLEQTADDQIVAAYSIATLADGSKSYEMMRRFEIDRVRETSKTGATKDRNGQSRQPSGPWVDWFPEMAKKTVMRRHSKVLPMSGDIIDVEGNEEDAARSSAALLASRQPDAPQIEQRDDEELPPHDAETGELHKEGERDDKQKILNEIKELYDVAPLDVHPNDIAALRDAGMIPQESDGEAKPKRTRRTRAQIEEDERQAAAQRDEGNEAAAVSASEASHAGETSQGQEPSATPAAARHDESEQHDEIGVVKSPSELKAEEIIEAMDKAANIIDLDRYYNENVDHLDGMPDEVAAEVNASWRRNRNRVKGGR
jgi:recombination protein RecT